MNADASSRSPADPDEIEVEVAYALPGRQLVLRLRVPAGCSAWEAVRRSGIAEHFEGLRPERARLGIFGRPLESPRRHVLQPGDRVEIYRPLVRDPRAARRRRARDARG